MTTYQNDTLTNMVICTIGIARATAHQNDDPHKVNQLHLARAIAHTVQRMETVPRLTVSLQEGYLLVYGEVIDTLGEEYMVTVKLDVPDGGTLSDTFCVTGATVNGRFLCCTQMDLLNKTLNSHCVDTQATTVAGHDGWEGSYDELDDTEVDLSAYNESGLR